MAKNQNTYEKRRREMEKKQRAAEKNERRRNRKKGLDDRVDTDTVADVVDEPEEETQQ